MGKVSRLSDAVDPKQVFQRVWDHVDDGLRSEIILRAEHAGISRQTVWNWRMDKVCNVQAGTVRILSDILYGLGIDVKYV